MPYIRKSITKRLAKARETILIVQSDTELREIMAKFGFGEAEFTTGFTKFEAASGLDAEKRSQLGNQVASTAALTEVYKEARAKFTTDRRMVRQALAGQHELLETLRTNINLGSSRDEFLYQAKHFYNGLIQNEEALALLESKFKITKEAIEISYQELLVFEEALKDQLHQKGLARLATQRRREAMSDLDDWMKSFIAVAKVAFKDDPKQLEKLDID